MGLGGMMVGDINDPLAHGNKPTGFVGEKMMSIRPDNRGVDESDVDRLVVRKSLVCCKASSDWEGHP